MNATKPADDARVIWARGCEPPRPPQYPRNNEAAKLEWTQNQVRDLYRRDR